MPPGAAAEARAALRGFDSETACYRLGLGLTLG